MSDEILIIWNATAGSAGNHARLRAELERRAGVTIHESNSGPDAAALARQAVDRGVGLIVAAGGDGTVHAVVQGLAVDFTRARLAVLPLGTGNDLCRTLAVPSDPFEAAEFFTAGRATKIDLVRVDADSKTIYMINMATGGNTTQAHDALTGEMKARWGPLAYLRGAVAALGDLDVYNTSVRIDGGPPERFEALNVIVGNGRTSGGGFQSAPHANPEDGLMELIVILDGPPIELAGLAVQYAVGDYLQSEQVVYRRARHVEIESEPALPLSIDGDRIECRSAAFQVLPQALRVLVGPEYSPERQNTGP